MRGLGGLRTHPAKLARTLPASHHPLLGRALAALPESAQIAPWGILDQGATGSCTAHALVGAVSAAKRCAFFSPDMEYKLTRALARADSLPADATLPGLVDGGAELGDAIAAMGRIGATPIGPSVGGRYSDVDPATVNAEPDFARIEAAATTIVTGEYTVQATGSARSDQIAAAIAAGFPVYVGCFVDSAFEALQPGQIADAPDTSDPNGGGHALFLSGFAPVGGVRVFTVTNSWGVGWGDNGQCLAGPAWIEALWEAWVVSVTILGGAT